MHWVLTVSLLVNAIAAFGWITNVVELHKAADLLDRQNHIIRDQNMRIASLITANHYLHLSSAKSKDNSGYRPNFWPSFWPRLISGLIIALVVVIITELL